VQSLALVGGIYLQSHRFADNTVKQSGKSKMVYGIQIKQEYFSQNYGDTGYLFLLIDFTDSIAPQISVRT